MDFFEAQARAKKRTSRLVLLFVLAVIGTVAGTYLAAIALTRQSSDLRMDRPRYGGQRMAHRSATSAWWDPRLFAGVAAGTLGVVGLASLYKWHQFSAGGRAVAETVGGRHVASNTTDLSERRLLNVVEEMALAAGVPVPPVYVMDDEPAINAFAAGLTTSDAVVAVTRGTIEKLSRDELQGVVAHEFSHILNGDMRLNMRLTALVFGILVLGLFGRGILSMLGRTRVRTRGKGAGAIAGILLIGLALMIIGYVGYFFGRLIQAAVSRQREFLADASAVQFTRNPGGIAGALKKIGGYALGSSLVSTKSAEIGHFFFAQGFRSGITGWWSTHPPLAERIRAIEPQFDGKMFDPPAVVDVATESFQVAGFQRGHRLPPDETVRRVFELPADIPPLLPRTTIPFQPNAAVAGIGLLTPGRIANAQRLLDAFPDRLRQATQTAGDAQAVVYGLLLDANPAVRARQLQIMDTRAGPEARGRLEALDPALQQLGPEQRLPLLQLTLPALRELSGASLERFLDVLDELVHADQRISAFEFALQKLLVRTLGLGANPGGGVAQYHSITALAPEIGVVLSAMAGAMSRDPALAPKAFLAGTAQLQLIQERLRFTSEADLTAVDAALDKLAAASLPIKQLTLTAAAHVMNADGQIMIEEFELLRAIAAALDCPMPPVGI